MIQRDHLAAGSHQKLKALSVVKILKNQTSDIGQIVRAAQDTLHLSALINGNASDYPLFPGQFADQRIA